MPWSNLPLTDGATDVHHWPFLRQLRDAIGQRARVAGSYWWPRPSRTWGTGVVPAGITATGFDDPNANDGDGWCPSDGIPWSCNAGDTSTPSAGEWWLVVDDCDPTKCVRTRITAFTSTALTFDDISDQVAAGYLPSLASLEGKTYHIVGYSYARWWHERIMGGSWLEAPNEYEWATGTVREYHDDHANPTDVTNPTTSSLKDDSAQWASDEHDGRDLIVYGDDGRLHRVAITSNSRQVLMFGTQAWTPSAGQPYVVVDAGAAAVPGKSKLRPFKFYSGLMTGYASHAADDQLGVAELPAASVVIAGSNEAGTDCDGVEAQAFDADPWMDWPLSPADLACGAPADKPYNPDVWKSVRAWQLAVENYCTAFVEVKDYEDEPWIPLLNPAALFKSARARAAAAATPYDVFPATFTTTVTAVTGVGGGHTSNAITFTAIAADYAPHNCYWSLTKSNGDYKYGTGLLTSTGALVSHNPGGIDQFDDRTDVGRTIVVSLGWSRFQPREFKRMFPAAAFIPDVVVVMGTPGVIDPPAINYPTDGCTGAGQWLRRLPSTHYVDRNVQAGSWVEEAVGLADDGPDAFVAGEYARYVGDNFTDGSVIGFGGIRPAADDVQAPYFDHFYNGSAAPEAQRQIDSQRGGRATSGSTTQLTHAGRNWFDHIWFGGGVLRTETGTATSGSTTSLTDSTKTSGAAACWWADARFNGFAGPWVGFTVEVLISGASFSDPAAVIAKRLVTSGDDATATIGWADALPSTASGKAYRIREPQYALNRWEGRTLQLKRRDPTTGTVTTATATVTGNDDDTLFFSATAFAVDAHTRYRIVEPKFGGVFTWTGSAWEQAAGPDAARRGAPTPADFHLDPRENHPTYVRRYGKLIVGDAVSAELLNELHAAIDAMRWTRLTPSWCNPDSVANNKSGTETDTDNQYDSWNDFWTDGTTLPFSPFRHYQGVQEAWDLATATFADPGEAPFSAAYGENQNGGGAGATRVGGYTKRTNQATVTVPATQCGLLSEVDWWVRCSIDLGDHDAGSECVPYEFDVGQFNYSFYTWEFNGVSTAENVKFRAMHKWDGETTPSDDADRVSSFLGDDIEDHQEIPTDPALSAGSCLVHPAAPNNDLFSAVTAGWYAKEKFAVVRWDVAGGLDYVT
jgi:hypothetical protein